MLLSIITFLAAFLLFQIELIIAKLFLPVYGGSFMVWGACVVFFQAVLLLGYLFAHQMAKTFGIGRYLKIHFLLMLVPFLFFPGRPIDIVYAQSNLPVVVDIFWRLTITIGPVFFILSTMSLVTQAWLSASVSKHSHHPYRLYAISNIGSFAALLSYPFVVELYLTNTEQLTIWRGLYVLLAVLSAAALKFIPVYSLEEKGESSPPPSRQRAIQWLLLGAAGVVMFLSVTNIISYEVAPIPLMWIIPLSIYLLCFVLNFKSNPWCPAWIKSNIAFILSLNVAAFFFTKLMFLPPLLEAIMLNVLLFIDCLFIQNRLIELKPSKGNLTLYYVFISFGGFLGGIATTWIIPLVSTSLIEFLFGVFLMAAVMGREDKKVNPFLLLGAFLTLGVLVVWPHLFKEYNLRGLFVLIGVLAFSFHFLSKRRIWLLVSLALLLLLYPRIEAPWQGHVSVAKKRNYYGIYDIYDTKDAMRIMVHGTTLHGIEFMDPQRRWIPLGYYGPTSAVGEILGQNFFQAKTVAGIGLGAGTIAMYSKPEIAMDFYELDPDVLELARKHFGYLSLAPGPIGVIIGDARVSLINRPEAKYDVIVVDAFGGDSIPVHLINTDVIFKYIEHLNDKGGLLFHIPSRYFKLRPVLAAIAKETGAYAATKSSQNEGFTMQTDWAVLTWDQAKFQELITKHGWVSLKGSEQASVRAWSDDYSSVLPIVKLDDLAHSIRQFNPWKW